MKSRASRRIFFIFSVLLVLIWFPDYTYNANSLARALPIVSYCEDGHFYFDKYDSLSGDKSHINGHIYTDKAPLPMFIVLPVVKAAQLAGFFSSSEANIKLTLAIGGLIISALPLLLIMLWLFDSLEKIKPSWKNYWLATLPFVSSFLWVYSASFYSHIFAGFLLVLVFMALEKKQLYWAGFFTGLIAITEYPVILLAGLWLLQMAYIDKKFKYFIQFGIGFLPAVLFLMIYNYSISGNFLSLGYDNVSPEFAKMKVNYGFSFPTLNALWGLTFSLYRGIFIYAPILIPIVIFAVLNFTKAVSFKRVLLHSWFVPFVLYVVFISGYFMWWGGWAWGPRHLIPVLIFIIFYEVKYGNLYRHLIPFAVAGAIGLIITFFAKLTILYNFTDDVAYPIALVFEKVMNNDFPNHQSFFTTLFKAPPLHAGAVWLLVYILAGIALSTRKKASV